MPFLPTRSLLPLAGFALVLVMAPFLIPNSFVLGVTILAILNAAVAVGLNLFVGSAGQISLGHAAFFGIGGEGLCRQLRELIRTATLFRPEPGIAAPRPIDTSSAIMVRLGHRPAEKHSATRALLIVSVDTSGSSKGVRFD